METTKGRRMTTVPSPFVAQPKEEARQSQSGEEVLTQLGSSATRLSATEVLRNLMDVGTPCSGFK